MIDFRNVKQMTVGRQGTVVPHQIGRKEVLHAAYQSHQSTGTKPTPGDVDQVKISSEAATKGRVSTFCAALAKEIGAPQPARLEALKDKYQGDTCPVDNFELAGAIVSRLKGEGASYE